MDQLFQSMLVYLEVTSVSIEKLEIVVDATLPFFKIKDPTLERDTLLSEWKKYLVAQKYISIATPPAQRVQDPHLKNYPISEAVFFQSLENNSIILQNEEMDERLEWIDTQPNHEQRSDEWYEFRNTLITASAAHQIFGPPSAKKLLKNQKAFPTKQRSGGGAACMHGIKFEPVATELYTFRNNVTVSEYGCIRHRDISHLGASPDGIVTSDGPLRGTMLEIKCPTSRPITGLPPPYYWIQVQLQLEVCNLEQCDFLECKFLEYENFGDFSNRSSTTEAGIILEYSEGKERKYLYSTIGDTTSQLGEWYETKINDILGNLSYIFLKATFWSVETYSSTRIVRHRDWFSSVRLAISSFWDEILELKENGQPENKEPITNIPKSNGYAFIDD